MVKGRATSLSLLWLLAAASVPLLLLKASSGPDHNQGPFENCVNEEVLDLAQRGLWFLGSRWMFFRQLQSDPELYEWTVTVIEDEWAWRDKNPTPLAASTPFDQRRTWYLELQEKRKNWRYKNQEILPKIPAFDDSLRKLIAPYIDQSRLEKVLRQGRVCEREAGLRDARRCVSFLRDELLGDFERAVHAKAASSMARWRELAGERCKIVIRRQNRQGRYPPAAAF